MQHETVIVLDFGGQYNQLIVLAAKVQHDDSFMLHDVLLPFSRYFYR